MGPDQLMFMIPIVAIVSAIGSSVVKRYITFRERELELRLMHSKTGDADVIQQLQELRQEIAQLRDTSTSYDLSIDHQLQQLERRMQYMEGKNIQTMDTGGSDEQTVQRIGQIR